MNLCLLHYSLYSQLSSAFTHSSGPPLAIEGRPWLIVMWLFGNSKVSEKRRVINYADIDLLTKWSCHRLSESFSNMLVYQNKPTERITSILKGSFGEFGKFGRELVATFLGLCLFSGSKSIHPTTWHLPWWTAGRIHHKHAIISVSWIPSLRIL